MGKWSRRALLKTGGVLGVTTIGPTMTAGRVRAVPGEELWSFETGDAIWSSPTVVNGTIYIGSYDNDLYAVDAGTGEQRWRFETGDSVRSSPTVVDGTVYVGSRDNHLYVVDAETGEQRWRFETGDMVDSSPTVVDGIVYVGSWDNTLYAADAESGEQLWRFKTSGIFSSPTVVDRTVFIGSRDNHLYAVDAETGEEKWRFETGGAVGSSPTVVDGAVFVGSSDGHLYAVDAESGEQRWRFETGDNVDSSPTVADGVVYIGGWDGNLYAVDAESGEQVWGFGTRGRYVASSPTVVDGTVYVGSDGNHLYAVDTESGEQRWRFETGGYVASSPTVMDGTVYVGSGDGNLYAIEARVEGSSEGSRVLLGTLGHHGTRNFAIARSTPTASPAPTESTEIITDPPLTQSQTASPTPSEGTGQQLPVRELGMGVGVLTAGVVVTKTLGYLQNRGQSEDESDTLPIKERIQKARNTVNDADSYEQDGNIETAIETLESAVTQYESLLESLSTTDDRYEDIAAELETAETKQEQLQARYANQTELIKEVESAETQFQTAIAAPTSDRVIIPRERYRQARDGYDRALDLAHEMDDPPETLTVSPDVDIGPPPENLSQFPGLTPSATEYLEEQGLDTLSALRDADEETIDALWSAEAIHEKLAVRLVALHHWLGDEDLTVEGRDDLEQRRELAADGYRVHQ